MDKVTNELSMVWYKIFYFLKLPISIALTTYIYISTYNFYAFLWDKLSLIIWFLIVASSVLYTILLYKMYYKAKDTYFYFIVCLIIDILTIISLRPTLFILLEKSPIVDIVLLIFPFIWFILNYIYINKRKHIFK